MPATRYQITIHRYLNHPEQEFRPNARPAVERVERDSLSEVRAYTREYADWLNVPNIGPDGGRLGPLPWFDGGMEIIVEPVDRDFRDAWSAFYSLNPHDRA